MTAAESNKLFISDTERETIEGTIRELLGTTRPVNVAGHLAGPCDDILAVGANSIADIEKLVEELQTARDYLKAEGERVRRLTDRYAHMARTASASVKIIAESLGKWRNPELASLSPCGEEQIPPSAAASRRLGTSGSTQRDSSP